MAEGGLHRVPNTVAYGGRHAARRDHLAHAGEPDMDGLERLLKPTFVRKATRWKANNPKVISYAM